MRDGNLRGPVFRNIILQFRKWRQWGLTRRTRRRMACRRCGSEVLLERDKWLLREYPYYCPKCDENMYSFECVETCVPDGVEGV